MVDIDAQVDAERRMREANRRKDEFLAMLGHELRNPLVPIRNAAEMLNQLGGDDSRLDWVRDTLVRQVEHVTRLVDDLLDISHDHPRQPAAAPGAGGSLPCCAARMRVDDSDLMVRKRHQFDCRLPDEPLWVEGDAVRLMQILENLLTNAAKYTDEGGSDRIADPNAQGDQVVIEVVDNGLGIEPEMLLADLRPVRAGCTRGRPVAGRAGHRTGAGAPPGGLHGGEIHASSSGGGTGSRMTVRLPLLPKSSIPAPVQMSNDKAPGKGRVLVVDDDVDAGESMVILLGMYGYQVERAVDLPGALDAARRLRPQVVIMDLALPKADGFEIADRLRAMPEMGSEVSYISLSGFGQPADFRRSQEAGFVRHLVKPMNPAELNRLLKALLEDKDEQEA